MKKKVVVNVNQVQVKLGVVSDIRESDMAISLHVGTSTYVAHYSSTTNIYRGNDDLVSLDDIKLGSSIYVFGNASGTSEMFNVEKIVIKNKSKLARKDNQLKVSPYLFQLFDTKRPLLTFLTKGDKEGNGTSLFPKAYASQ